MALTHLDIPYPLRRHLPAQFFMRQAMRRAE
jgi:hypothetical protein